MAPGPAARCAHGRARHRAVTLGGRWFLARPVPAICAALVLLAGCGGPPDLDAYVSPPALTAAFPTLVAIDPIVDAHGGPVDGAPVAAPLQARADALARRAGQVQDTPVIDAATLLRLNAARAAAAAAAEAAEADPDPQAQ